MVGIQEVQPGTEEQVDSQQDNQEQADSQQDNQEEADSSGGTQELLGTQQGTQVADRQKELPTLGDNSKDTQLGTLQEGRARILVGKQ